MTESRTRRARSGPGGDDSYHIIRVRLLPNPDYLSHDASKQDNQLFLTGMRRSSCSLSGFPSEPKYPLTGLLY